MASTDARGLPEQARTRQLLGRRGFVRAAAGVAAAAASLPLLAACGTRSTVAPAAGTSVAAPGTKPANVLPTYIPSTTGPKPDIPKTDGMYMDGFGDYPANPVPSWKRNPPGNGGKVDIFTKFYVPDPPTPVDQNPAWQEINRQLNATINFSQVTESDYQARFAAIVAGNDLPDIAVIDGVGNLAQLLAARAADLTPYLAGDAAKDYPNLAAIPTSAWKNGGCVQNGKLYMVPIHRARVGMPGNMYYNTDIYNGEIGAGYVPKSADDFKRVLLALNRPNENRWATMSWNSKQFNFYHWFAPMFGLPNNWAVGSDGKLTKDHEAPQFKDALAFARDLVVSGVFHPNSGNIDPNTARNAFLGGQYVIDDEGFVVAWADLLVRGAKQNPPVAAGLLSPFPAREGDPPRRFNHPGVLVSNMLSNKAQPDRIRELLGIMDWLAAPFGSAEDLLISVGVTNTDYTLDSTGKVLPTDRSNNDAARVNWKYVATHPQVAYWPGLGLQFAKNVTDYEKSVIAVGVDDPTWGLSSPTNDSKGVALTQTFKEGINDILAGRRPMSDVDQLVKDWQAGGGNQIRNEFAATIAAGA